MSHSDDHKHRHEKERHDHDKHDHDHDRHAHDRGKHDHDHDRHGHDHGWHDHDHGGHDHGHGGHDYDHGGHDHDHGEGGDCHGDGIVTGTSGNDRIDLTYTGDPDGDMIDNEDAILPGAGPNDDVVYALDGDDTVEAGLGDDLVYAGSGADSVSGEAGNDTLYGDSNNPDSVHGREVFQWDQLPDPDDGGEIDDRDMLEGPLQQDTGNVTVTFQITHGQTEAGTDFRNNDQNVDGIESDGDPVDANSSMGSTLFDEGAGVGYQLSFSNEVGNVAFRVNDIDGDGVVRIHAFDAEGNEVPVNLTGGANLTLLDSDGVPGADTADSNGGYEPDDSPNYSLLVEIPGPVSRLVIEHEQDGANPSGINVTDVYFDTMPAEEDGDDTLDGGAGDDLAYGEGGDDVLLGGGGSDTLDGGRGDDLLEGGDGADLMDGGSGDDTLSGDNGDAGDAGDTMLGGTGDDRFVNISQGDTIVGGEDADGGDTDVLDLTGAAEAANPGGRLHVEYNAGDPESGVVHFFDADGVETGQAEFSEIETVIPCFTPGTLIATPQGERPVEELQIGDRVITRDNGMQEILWIGQRTLSGGELARASQFLPIRIRAGALGGGLPERDMLVSPNHRVLIFNARTSLFFDDSEVLVAAKHLTGMDGIDQVQVDEVTYIHFMFARHEVVLSNGAWTESFQPGEWTLDGMEQAQREELFELFPELRERDGIDAFPAARRILKKHEARLLVH